MQTFKLLQLNQLDWPKALRTAVLCALTLGLGQFMHLPFAVSVTLGVVAGALAEGPDFYRTPYTSALVMLSSFAIASLSVTLLYPYPPLFFLGVASSSYLFMLMPRLGGQYGAIALSSLIVACYTMLGYSSYDTVWLQPLCLVTGALLYALSAIGFNHAYPSLDLDKQLRRLFRLISGYLIIKARYFSEESQANNVEKLLSDKAAQIAESFAQVRHALYLHQQRRHGKPNSLQMDRFFLAQLLFERLSSSHFNYQALEQLSLDANLRQNIQTTIVELAREIPLHRQNVSSQLKASIYQLARLSNNRSVRGLSENMQDIQALLEQPPAFPEPQHRFAQAEEHGFRHFFSHLLHLRHPLNRHAMRMALLVVLSYSAELITQDVNMFWMMLSCILVTKPNYSDTRSRMTQRMLGTIAGVVFAALFSHAILPQAFQLALLPVLVGLFFLFFHQNYAFSVGMVTIYVAISLEIQGASAIEFLPTRLSATIIGCLAALAALRWLWPQWSKLQSQSLLSKAIDAGKHYQHLVIEQSLTQSNDENTPFRLARFQALQGLASLNRHWQQLLAEPTKQGHLSANFYQLIGYYNNWISHLAALSSHRQRPLSELEKQVLQRFHAHFEHVLSELLTNLNAGHEQSAAIAHTNWENTILSPEETEQSLHDQLQLIANDVDALNALCNTFIVSARSR